MATQVQQQSVPDAATPWSTDLTFNQFNPSLGTLDGINVGLAGDLNGSVSIENLQSGPASVDVTLSGTLGLGNPGGALLETASPVASGFINLGAYDGTTDFAGSSGTVVAMSATATSQATLAPVASFVGAGSVAVPVTGSAYLFVTGPANMELQSGAAVGAAATVTYNYLPPAPGNGGSPGGSGVVIVNGGSGVVIVNAGSPPGPFTVSGGFITAVSPVQTFNFADSTAGWSNNVIAQQFDPALGTLVAVNLNVATDILASVAAVNLDPVSQDVATTQTINTTLTIPVSGTVAESPIVVPVSAAVSDAMNLGAYDGSTSFQGASGRTDNALSAASATGMTLTGDELSAFLGTGTIDLSIATGGTATVSGPANLLLAMLAETGASVSLSYSYIPNQPAAGELLFDQPGSYDLVGTPPASTVDSSNTIAPTQTVQSVVIDSPGATVFLDGPLDVTGGFTLEAGTLVIESGSLAVGSYLQTGGVISGNNVTIVAAGSIDIMAGSMVAAGTVDLQSQSTIILDGSIDAGAVLVASASFIQTIDGTAVPITGLSFDDPTTPPVLTVAASGPPSIFAGGTADFTTSTTAAIQLDPSVWIGEGESPAILTGTVSISQGFLAGDILNVGTTYGGIITNYNTATGVLTLAGPAALTQYQDTLDSITYSFSGDPTNGGSDDSRTISWVVNDGTSSSAAGTSSLTVAFPNEPQNDLQFQNADGQVALWQVNGSSLSAFGVVGSNPGPAWSMVATGAFYPGGGSGIVWQNQDGQVAIWQVQATTLESYGLLGPNPGSSWHVRAAGTFYSDGNLDLVWQNDSGQVGLWDVSGTDLVQYNAIGPNPGPTWHVEGTGDFFHDGNTDILFQNDDGQVGLWDMNGATIESLGAVSANPGSSWMIKGTGDFYGDGNTDILWQNANGAVALWDMNGTTIEASTVIANPGPAWHVVGTGDFNNNGMTDIMFQSDSGQVAIWEMNHTTITAAVVLANPGTSWSVVDSDLRFIYSTAANETLTAAAATPDEFVFTNYAAGAHTIAGFNPVQDMIEFSSAQFTSYADVQSAMSSVAGGVAINLGNNSTLLLPGVDAQALHASNFVLA